MLKEVYLEDYWTLSYIEQPLTTIINFQCNFLNHISFILNTNIILYSLHGKQVYLYDEFYILSPKLGTNLK